MSNDIETLEDYAIPEEHVVYVEPEKGEVRDFKELTPWEQIVESAKRYSVEIQPPKKNCKKCFERGYTGFSVEGVNRIPISCNCIFKTKGV